MTLNRRIGLGFTLAVDTAGGTTFVTLGSIVDGWKESGSKADTADISILSDKYKQKSKGQIDPGDVTFSIAYDPDDATSTTLITAFSSTSATPPNWQITYPSGTGGAGTTTTETFKGHLTGLGREVMKDKLVVCEVTITKTGDPGFHGD